MPPPDPGSPSPHRPTPGAPRSPWPGLDRRRPRPPPSDAIGHALLIVGVQCDRLAGGAIEVPGAERVLEPIGGLVDAFAASRLSVFASRDWHPPHHASFIGHGGSWPPHCVAGTPGAALAPQLRLPPGAGLVSRGTHTGDVASSAFARTDLGRRLRDRGVGRLVVCGLATEDGVLATVLDALRDGHAVVVPACAVAARQPDAGLRALDAMRGAGARILDGDRLADWLDGLRQQHAAAG